MPRVKHVVLMKIKPGTSAQAIEDIYADLARLKSVISGMADLSGGAYSSAEGLSQGFTHGFVMSFTDDASRDAYLAHPDHEIVKRKIIAVLDGGLSGVVAFDYRY